MFSVNNNAIIVQHPSKFNGLCNVANNYSHSKNAEQIYFVNDTLHRCNHKAFKKLNTNIKVSNNQVTRTIYKIFSKVEEYIKHINSSI